MDAPSANPRFFKVIACEIAFREICHVAARSPHLHDLEFLTQGYHGVPCSGREEIEKRINAVPAGKYDAILLGYGLCSNILGCSTFITRGEISSGTRWRPAEFATADARIGKQW
jgi:hypothetical protein